MTIHDYENGFAETNNASLTDAVDWVYDHKTDTMSKNLYGPALECLAKAVPAVKDFLDNGKESTGPFTLNGRTFVITKGQEGYYYKAFYGRNV